MNKLTKNEIKKLEKITKIIEDNGKMTNTGYQVEEMLYHYGNFAKLMEKTDVDVDNDFLENNLLYVIIDNEIYKVIEEDIEEDIEKENYFVVSSRKNGDEFIENFKTEKEALNHAGYLWNNLVKKEKENTTVAVGKGIYEELTGYNPIKEYTYDYLIDYNEEKNRK